LATLPAGIRYAETSFRPSDQGARAFDHSAIIVKRRFRAESNRSSMAISGFTLERVMGRDPKARLPVLSATVAALAAAIASGKRRPRSATTDTPI
jgi:hypothetical protein